MYWKLKFQYFNISKYFGSVRTSKLRGTRHTGRYSAAQSSQLSWTGQYNTCDSTTLSLLKFTVVSINKIKKNVFTFKNFIKYIWIHLCCWVVIQLLMITSLNILLYWISAVLLSLLSIFFLHHPNQINKYLLHVNIFLSTHFWIIKVFYKIWKSLIFISILDFNLKCKWLQRLRFKFSIS